MIGSVAVCGVGRLGLPLALNFEKTGTVRVVGFDNNKMYVEKLNSHQFISDEPGVNELLAGSGMSFSADVHHVLSCEAALLCVRTDSLGSGEYDLSQLWSFMSLLKAGLQASGDYALKYLIVNCNVNPGTTRLMAQQLAEYAIEVYFWPEWVKQGTILSDQTHPPVTVIGRLAENKGVDEVVSLVTTIDANEKPADVRLLGLIEAEICKVSLNCFLTVKISFANMVANLVEEIGLDPAQILEALGHDPRIGGAFLKPGFGYGGPCLPRDNKALIAFASDYGIDLPLCRAADAVNEQRHQLLSKHAARAFHASGELPAVETLSYKAGISIFTESQQLRFSMQMSKIGIPSAVSDKITLKRAMADYGEKLIVL